jgi:hypothetical protein
MWTKRVPTTTTRLSNPFHRAYRAPALCDAQECEQKEGLSWAFGGWWCKSHLQRMTELREKIAPHKGDWVEIEARFEELRMRRNPDPGHSFWAMHLWRRMLEKQGSTTKPPLQNPSGRWKRQHYYPHGVNEKWKRGDWKVNTIKEE